MDFGFFFLMLVNPQVKVFQTELALSNHYGYDKTCSETSLCSLYVIQQKILKKNYIDFSMIGLNISFILLVKLQIKGF